MFFIEAVELTRQNGTEEMILLSLLPDLRVTL
jgi:hypothetical protein